MNFDITKWLENEHKHINAAYHAIEALNEGSKPRISDIEVAYKFI